MKSNPAVVYLSRWAEGSDTYVTMLGALNTIASECFNVADATHFAWHELRYEDVRAVPGKLAAKQPATINKLLSALRGVLQTCLDMRLISAEEFERMRVRNVRGESEPAGRALTEEEKARTLVALPAVEPQEAALIAIMLGAGARRVEVVKICADNFDLTSGRITLYGKGRKPRKVPVGKNFRPFIERYVDEVVATRGKRALLFPFDRRRVSYLVACFFGKLGIDDVTPHDLRRTFGTHICDVADPVVAQRLLGHKDIKTTMLYDRRGEKAEEDAVEDW